MGSIITQEAQRRKQYLKYAERRGVTATSERFGVSRKTIHKLRSRFDGTLESLRDRSRRPKSHPRQHTAEEAAQVKRSVKKHGSDLILAYQRLREKGYTRSYGGFRRYVCKNLRSYEKKKPKRKPKPYERAEYPGQKLQLDVKFVPSECVVNGQKYYQFTALDECTRWTYREMYDEHSTYSAKQFLDNLVRTAPFPIRLIQTDNGTEWTNALLVTKAKHKTLFEQSLLDIGIEYNRIQIATPRHNGKVERQHRTDQLRFYSKLRMFSLADGRKQLAKYNRDSNNYIKSTLNLRSPNSVLSEYLDIL